MKGSGKTRTLNLIVALSKDGKVLNSLTEAVLFRTSGTLAIDEFEGMNRQGKENLIELLNSAYKKGTNVMRMKKGKVLDPETGKFHEDMIVEEFSVYRPICLANISGMETVLGDRCIPLILEKSFNKKKVNLIEVFRENNTLKKVKEMLESCRKCRCRFMSETGGIYEKWNSYIESYDILDINNTNNTNDTNDIIPFMPFKTINSLDLTGREIELCFPLFMLGNIVSNDVFTETTGTLSEIFKTKRDEDFVENYDISLIDFVSQLPEGYSKHFHSLKTITDEFREFLQLNDEWINQRWIGRALKRTELVIEKRRKEKGREVTLNREKALRNIRKYK